MKQGALHLVISPSIHKVKVAVHRVRFQGFRSFENQEFTIVNDCF